jgi:DNA repair protein RecO (recombination protein O)
MKPEISEGFLLRATPYGEADLVAALLTRRWGRIAVLAKGARKSRRRFGGALDYFHHLRAEVRPGRSGMGRLLGVELVRPFGRLRENVEAYWAGSQVLEVARLGTREGDPDEPFFSLVEATLAALDRGGEPRSLVRVFQARALAALGYGLPVEECPACAEPYGGYGAACHAAGPGGIRCGSCAEPGAVRLSPGTLRTLRAAVELPLDRLGGLRVSASAEEEAGPLLEAGLTAALGVRPRALTPPIDPLRVPAIP